MGIDLDAIGLEPSLDYLHGYAVTKATRDAITFENGAVVTDEDSSISDATRSALVGKSLSTTILTAGGETKVTRLIFAKWVGNQQVGESVEISLVPGRYTIADPRFKGVSRPQTVDNPVDSVVAVEDDAVDPREAQGPDEDWKAAQGTTDAE